MGRWTYNSYTMATKTKSGEPLPKHLKRYFPGYAFGRLRWPQDRHLLIAEVLAKGDWEAITWLRGQVTPEELAAWIMHRQGRGLSVRQLRYWELVLDLPHRDVNSWIERIRSTPAPTFVHG